jgi:YfiH family protein
MGGALDGRGEGQFKRQECVATTVSGRWYPDAQWIESFVDGVPCWQSDVLLSAGGLEHAFTGRGWNLSTRSGADTASTVERRRTVCTALGLPADSLVVGEQVHGVEIALVSDADRPTTAISGVDGLITSAARMPLLALSADCPLIIVYDSTPGLLGIAHSGWRGTLGGMPRALIGRLTTDLCGRPSDAIAVVSPCAGAGAYEIQADVLAAVDDATGAPGEYVRRQDGRMFLDLPGLIADQLASAGLSRERIFLPRQCTISDERFYSYRRMGPDQGHAGLVVAMS